MTTTTVTVSWIDSNGDWKTPSDWSPHVAPNDTSSRLYEVYLDSAGAYTVTISPGETFTVGSLHITDPAATLGLHNGASLTDKGAATNAGALYVDTGYAEGGSKLTIDGTLANSGVVQVGPNTLNLSAATTLALGGLTNASGASFLLYGSGSHEVTLALSGGLGFTGNSGNFEEYYGAPLTINSSFSNTSTGTFGIHDHTTLTVTGGFSNAGALYVDTGYAEGGSKLTIDGTLANSGVVQVGPNTLNLSAATTLALGGLTNASGASFLLYGSGSHEVTLALSGGLGFTGNSGNFEEYYGAPLTINSSFSNTSTGTFGIHDHTTLTVTGGFSNAGALYVDTGYAEGGSKLTIDGTLANSGVVQVGPNTLNLSAATTLALGGLTNASGASFLLYGSGSHEVTLALSGGLGFTGNSGNFEEYYGAPLTINSSFSNTSTGTFGIHDHTTLTVTGGFSNAGALYVDTGYAEGGSKLTIDGTLANSGVVQVGPNTLNLSAATTLALGGLTNASGASFLLYGSGSHEVTLALSGGLGFTGNSGNFEEYYGAPLTINSSFSNTSTGTFGIHDHTTLTVTGGFSNAGALYVDTGYAEGGSKLTIDGTLANSGVVQVGPNTLNLSAATTLALGGLTNASGASFLLYGSGSHEVTLALSGGLGFTGNSGNFEEYYGAPLTINSSFSNTSTGTFGIHDHTTLTVTGGFSNAGALYVDTGYAEGGSKLTIDGTLANSGVVQVGPNTLNLSAATTLALGGLTNASGASFLLYGSAGHAAIAKVTGATKNTGTIGVTEGRMTFIGSVTNNGSGSGLLDIGNAGNITLDDGSDSHTSIDFQTSNGLLNLQKPLSFGGMIDGFALGDKIDLLQTVATGDSFSGGILAVKHGSTTVAKLHFAGSYTTGSFMLGTDNHNGTFITHS